VNLIGQARYTVLKKNMGSKIWQHDYDLMCVVSEIVSPISLIIANIYLSPRGYSHKELERLMRDLVASGKDFLITGDFNAHHTIWGSNAVNSRGSRLLNAFDKYKLEVINTGEKTYFKGKSSSCLDLTVVSRRIFEKTTWNVLDNIYDTDHIPQIIEIETTRSASREIGYNFNKHTGIQRRV
jgi:Endonuclease-reverse transcriptase